MISERLHAHPVAYDGSDCLCSVGAARRLGRNQCEGHDLLPTPRPENSCATVISKIHASPDKKLHATVLPAKISLNATPDMESRVVIRSVAGDTLNSLSHASPRGMNGFYVDAAQWSPNSQFFVYNPRVVRRTFAMVSPDHGL